MVKGILIFCKLLSNDVASMFVNENMMYRLVFLILTASAFFSCKKEAKPDCTTDIYNYEFHIDSKIDTVRLPFDYGLIFQVKPGSDLVFLYTHTGPSCKSIWDEEFTNKLIFKVPSSVSSFYYENSQLVDVMCYFKHNNIFSHGALAVTSGFVRGNKRLDGKWDIEINVVWPGSTVRLIINKTFVPH